MYPATSPSSTNNQAGGSSAAPADATSAPSSRAALRGQGLEQQEAALAPPRPGGSGEWADPAGPRLDRRIRHAQSAAHLGAIRHAVEAALAGNTRPLAAVLDGHRPVFSQAELSRLLRHCEARATELGRRPHAEAGPATPTTPPAPHAASAPPQVGPIMAGPATPMTTHARAQPGLGNDERVAPIFRVNPAVVAAEVNRQSDDISRAFAEIGQPGALALLRAAILREASQLRPDQRTGAAWVGATSNGQQVEMPIGGRLGTLGGERGVIGIATLQADDIGRVTITMRVTNIAEHTLVVRLNRYTAHQERRQTAADTQLTTGALLNNLGQLSGRTPPGPGR